MICDMIDAATDEQRATANRKFWERLDELLGRAHKPEPGDGTALVEIADLLGIPTAHLKAQARAAATAQARLVELKDEIAGAEAMALQTKEAQVRLAALLREIRKEEGRLALLDEQDLNETAKQFQDAALAGVLMSSSDDAAKTAYIRSRGWQTAYDGWTHSKTGGATLTFLAAIAWEGAFLAAPIAQRVCERLRHRLDTGEGVTTSDELLK